MPRWWRRKRRQAKADSQQASADPAGPSTRKRPPPGSAPATRESKQGSAEAKAPEPEAKPRVPAKPPPDPKPPVDAKPESDAEPAEPKLPDDAKPAGDAEPPRPLRPVPPPDAPSPAQADPPPAAARAADAGSGPDEAPVGAEPDGIDEEDSDLSWLADKVQAVLVAAESTAERIRRDAEADAARIAEERERQRHAARELVHLERLADALSVQAESVKRQCAVLRDLLPAVDDAAAEPPDPALAAPTPGKPAGEVRVRDLRGERHEADPPATPPEGGGNDSSENGRRFPHISRERIEAYRLKLAGAARTDVEAYLSAAGVAEAAEITAELFEPVAPARSLE